MPNRDWCLLGVLFIASGSSLIAQETRCESLPNNNAKSECLYAELKKAEAEMQTAYVRALSLNDPNRKEENSQPLLPKIDRKSMRESRQHMTQKLRDSQRLWLQYREQACGAVEDKYEGGTIVGEVVPLCKIDLTEQRTKFLRVNFSQ